MERENLRLAKKLVQKYGIESFDFDKEYFAQWARFGYDPVVQPGVKKFVSTWFDRQVEEAFNDRKNFSFETNYQAALLVNFS